MSHDDTLAARTVAGLLHLPLAEVLRTGHPRGPGDFRRAPAAGSFPLEGTSGTAHVDSLAAAVTDGTEQAKETACERAGVRARKPAPRASEDMVEMDNRETGAAMAGRPDGPIKTPGEELADPGATGESSPDATTPANGSEKEEKWAWPMSTLEELKGRPSPAWLIDGILQERALAVLYGRPGVGKTFLALDMALSVATGANFHGHATLQGRVAYLAVDSLDYLDVRCDGWLQRNPGIDPGDLLFCDVPVMLNDQQSVSSFTNELQRRGSFRLVVIDTLAHCNDGDENSASDMQALIRGIRAIRDRVQTAVLLIHHTPKEAREMRGSGALRAGIDTAILFEPVDRDPVGCKLSCDKQRNAQQFQPLHLERVVVSVAKGDTVVLQRVGSPAGHAPPLEFGTTLAEELPTQLQQIVDILADLPSRSMMQKDLETRLNPTPKRTVGNRIDKLVQLKRVRRVKSGRENLISLIDPADPGS